MVEELRPSTIVTDSLPRMEQQLVAELARSGVAFMRLKDLRKLSEERKRNGVRKSHENDVKILRELFRRHPEAFQPLFSSPEELEVRALTELWVELAGMRRGAKQARTTTGTTIAIEIHNTLSRLIDRLAKEIHEKAMRLPLYRLTVEVLGLRGPALAYIVSHDTYNITMLPRNKLEVRYRMVPLYRSRPLRSHLLITLTRAVIVNKHPRYKAIYNYYRHKGMKHWKATLRVARRLLRDLRQLAQKAGTPPA